MEQALRLTHLIVCHKVLLKAAQIVCKQRARRLDHSARAAIVCLQRHARDSGTTIACWLGCGSKRQLPVAC
jgi:hypothetical protein